MPPSLPNLPRSLLERLFGIDLRSLALFRALLGLTLFLDLCWRSADLRVFYTDSGVMPRAWLTSPELPSAIGSLWRLNLHIANGTTPFTACLFGVEMLAALALALGWRTRLANLFCFVLQASLLNRNPMVLLGADTLMVCLLFWGLFLPLGARCSVDATLSTAPPPDRNQHLSWGSAGLLLQVMSVYYFSALLKTGGDWWPQGSAIDYVMQLDAYATPAGAWLRNFPQLEHAISYFVYFLELVGPWLMFVPLFTAPLRFATLLLFVIMQLGLWLCLRLGPWPYVSIAALSVFAGGWIWDVLARHGQQPQPAPLRLFYDGDCEFCRKCVLLLRSLLILPQATIAPAQENARARTLMEANGTWVVIDHDDHAYLKWPAFVVLLRRSPLFSWLGRLLGGSWLVNAGNAVYDFFGRHRSGLATSSARLLAEHQRPFETGRIAQGFAGILLLAVLVWNVATVQLLPPQLHLWLTPPLRLIRLDQRWDLFAPTPSKEDGWFVVPGELGDGTMIDVLHPERGTVSYDKPEYVAREWPDIRWHQYLERLWAPEFTSNRPYYARYLCHRWNAGHAADRQLRSIKLVYMLEMSVPAGETSHIEQRVIWRQDCPAQPSSGTSAADS